jgi:hypothetical protein
MTDQNPKNEMNIDMMPISAGVYRRVTTGMAIAVIAWAAAVLLARAMTLLPIPLLGKNRVSLETMALITCLLDHGPTDLFDYPGLGFPV